MSDYIKRFFNWLSSMSSDYGRSVYSSAPYWIAALVVGCYAVFYAKLFVLCESFAKYLFKTNVILFGVLSVVFFVVAWGIVHFLAPNAKGSGIPQVMAASEEATFGKSKYLGLRISLAKTLSSLFCSMGGGAIGREGPTLQVSASIFHFFGSKLNKYFNSKIRPDVWIIAGAAAGLSAAFNTPLGGLVYAIEELSRSHLNSLKTPLITAVIVSGLAAQLLAGPYLYIGLPNIMSIKVITYVYVIVTALVCGLLGALFGKLIYSLNASMAKFRTASTNFLVPVCVSLTLLFFALYMNVQILGSGKEVLNEMLFSSEGGEQKLSLVVARYIGPILTYISGVGGGIFAPSLAAGGVMGSYFAEVFDISNHNLLVLMGMVSFLTGVTRSPFTSFVLVLEMTDRHSVIMPMMMAALVASTAAPFVEEKSIYEKIKEDYLESTKTKVPVV